MSGFAQAIIAHLTLASNEAVAVAIGWHIAGAMAIVALLRGWRPSKRRAGHLLAVLIASSAAVAFVFGNPFNAAVLGALAGALVLLARRFEPGAITRGSVRATVLGSLLIAFGAFYPHFLATESMLTYLYAAPMGVIPCPTLAFVGGVTLCANGLESRAWCLTVTVAGFFYGIVGVALLGVTLDAVLVAGAVALLLAAFFEVPRRS